MTTQTINYRFRTLYATSTQLAATNPVLLEGEPVTEKDTLKQKIGDGVTAYNDLPYLAASAGGVATATAPITYNPSTQTVGINAATTSTAGSMSAADKSKLDGIAAGATANATDAQLRDRSTHTGTQSVSTITGLGTAATQNVGSAAGNVVQLDGSGRLPAVDGSQLTNLPGGGGGATDLGYTASTRLLTSSTGADVTLPLAGADAGLMSAADKTKLDGVATGATANSSDATLLNRANHTGTQAASTITGLASVATSGSYADLSNRPTLGTAAPLDVAAAGNASSGQVVKGNDSRLTDARPPTAHTQTASTISDSTAAGRALLTAADAAAQRTSLGLGTAATTNSSAYATAAQGSKADTAVQPGSLAAVATSGSYADLSNKPTLGTAAAANVGTSAGNVVALDGTGKLPAVDGSQLTNLPSGGGPTTLDGLSDVTITSPSNGQVVVYDSLAGVWKNDTIAGGGGGATDLGYTPSTRLLTSSTGADVTLPLATTSDAGLLSSSDKTKLDGIAAGAEVNVNADWNATSGDAQILNKPTLGTAAATDASAYATAAQGAKADSAVQPTTLSGYVQTSDSRLTDSREWSAATIDQAEAEAGTATTRRAFTAQRVFQAVAAWWAGSAAKAKLDGIAAGATANSSDATLLARANHTGTQTASTISDFNSAAAAAAPVQSVAGKTGAVTLSQADVSGTAASGPIGSSGLTLSAARLLGRSTAGTGAPEEIILGTGLSFSGTTLNATGGGGGGAPGGADTQIQFNDAGSFGGNANLTYNKTSNLLTTKCDISLDDGGSFTTTLQCVQPTANRAITFPDATGTVALVAGSSGQLLYNLNGSVAGTTNTFDTTNGTRFILPFGYGTGAGGTVTQTINKSTAVTLNTRCGQITMNTANLATGTAVTFTLTNSAIAATDVLTLNHVSGGTLGNYTFVARCAAGSATIAVRNVSAGDLAEAVVIAFAVIKAVTS